MTHDQYVQLVAQVHGLRIVVLLLVISLVCLWIAVLSGIGKR